MRNASHESSVAKFLFIEMFGTAVLTLVVALSTYQSWRTIGVIFYGVVYYMLLRGLSMFHLRYTESTRDGDDVNIEDDQSDLISLTPRFNPALTVAHFLMTGPFYNGSILKGIALLLASASSNTVGAMIGGTALMKIFEKPDGSALYDVYHYGLSYKQHNYTDVFASLSKTANNNTGIQAQMEKGFNKFVLGTRAVTYESLDHLYTNGAWVEFVGLCLLAYAFTVDDGYRSRAVDLDHHKTGSDLGKPVAVATAATLVGYVFADYTTGICNPAIAWGIFMGHDISAFWPHLVSSGVALLYICILCILGACLRQALHVFDPIKDKTKATWFSWGYDNIFLQFGGLFFLTVLALHSVGDIGVTSPMRPERWSTDAPIFYGLATAALVWTARHIGNNHDYFNPLANVSVRFVALLGYAQGTHEESKEEGAITKFIFVIIRDALAVFTGVVYCFYVSPMRDGHPHVSHFVAVGFASYNTKVFKDSISLPGETEATAFQQSIAQGISWPYLIAPEIIATGMLVLVTMGAVLQDKELRKSNALLFGLVSALNIYLFGTLTTGTCNAWLSMFSLLIDGNWSEFWSERVGIVHVAGVLTLILIVTILLFDDMLNERGEGRSGVGLDVKMAEVVQGVPVGEAILISTKSHAVHYAPMKSMDRDSTQFVSNAESDKSKTSIGMWEM